MRGSPGNPVTSIDVVFAAFTAGSEYHWYVKALSIRRFVALIVPVEVREVTVVAFNVAVPVPVCVILPAVDKESTVVVFRVAVAPAVDWVILLAVEKLPALCVIFPELEREVTEVPSKVLDPPV